MSTPLLAEDAHEAGPIDRADQPNDENPAVCCSEHEGTLFVVDEFGFGRSIAVKRDRGAQIVSTV
jgi:hypothetical protein